MVLQDDYRLQEARDAWPCRRFVTMAQFRGMATSSPFQGRRLMLSGSQYDRYEERVRPRRRASRNWVRSRTVILALATLSR